MSIRSILVLAAYAPWFWVFHPVCLAGPVTLTSRCETLPQTQVYGSLLANSIQASPDAAHVLYTVSNQDRVAVTLNGVGGQPYAQIVGPVFSPDSKRHAYLARRDNLWWLVVNDQARIGFPPHDVPVFSPDSMRSAYWARDGNRRFLVIDDVDHPRFDHVDTTSLRFSPDSSRVAYVAQHGGAWFVVTDGQKGPDFDRIVHGPVFSDDSSRLVYVAVEAQRQRVVVNGGVGQVYDEIATRPVCSPDGVHLAYWAKPSSDDRWVMVLDGRQDAKSQADAPGDLIFSPDSKRLAVTLKRGSRWHTVVDGRVGPPCDAIEPGSLMFSPDSRRIVYTAQNGYQWSVYKNSQRHPVYDRVLADSVQFSRDSRRLAYAGFRNGQWVLVIDGYEQPGFERILPESIRFSDDGSRLAYVGVRGTKQHVVVDEDVKTVCDRVTMPVFGPQSPRVAWIAKRGEQWRVVVNGLEDDHIIARVVPGAKLVFDSPTDLHTVIMDDPGPGWQAYRLDIKIHSTTSAWRR